MYLVFVVYTLSEQIAVAELTFQRHNIVLSNSVQSFGLVSLQITRIFISKYTIIYEAFTLGKSLTTHYHVTRLQMVNERRATAKQSFLLTCDSRQPRLFRILVEFVF